MEFGFGTCNKSSEVLARSIVGKSKKNLNLQLKQLAELIHLKFRISHVIHKVMGKTTLITTSLLLAAISLSAQTSGTYNTGDIGTVFINNTTNTTIEAPCADTITINIPPGDLVTSVDVVYDMTSLGFHWMAEQFSYLECATTGIKEASLSNGAGSSPGTFSYTRSGLNIANGISATGELKFVLHGFRTFSAADPTCNTLETTIDDNSWTVTVNHIPPPTCPFPTVPLVQSVSSNSVLLTWNSGGATNWQVEYGPAGFAPGNGTIVNATSNPFSLTGLTPSTAYDWFVRDSCAPGDVSIWTAGTSFSTLCTPATAPWINGLEGAAWVTGTGFFNAGDAINTCFDRDPGGIPAGTFTGDFYWGAGQGPSANFGSGPSVDHTLGTATGKYMYAVAALGNNGDVANISTRLVDLSPLTVPELRFWYHMFGTDMGTLNVEVDNGTGFVNVWSITGQQQTAAADPWLEAIVPIPQFAGDTIRVRFVATSTGGFQGEMAIDDISLDEAPTCPQPNNLQALAVGATNVNLDWTPGLASDWNIAYGAPGFSPLSGTIVNVTGQPYNLTGLTPDTDYEIYVRDSCGTGDVSVWVGPLAIRTACLPTAAPYAENFDGADWAPGTGFNNANDQINSCWDRDPGTQSGFNGDYFWGVGTGQTGTFNTGPFGDNTSGTGQYMFVESSFGAASQTAELESPLVDLSPLTVPELRFYYHMFGASTGSIAVEINNGTGWTQVFSISGQQQTALNDPWLEAIVNISGYAGDTVQVRFIATRGTFGQGDMAIDDVSLDEAPSCPQPSNLVALSVGSDNVSLDWTSSSSDNNISFGPPGFNPTSGTIANATGAPYTLTGLSPNTTYEIYVRDSCGTGDVSAWVGPITITTNCLPFAAPFIESFDGASWVSGTGFANGNDAIDNCWARDPEGNTGTFGSPYFWGTRSGPSQSFGTGPDNDHTTGSGNYVFTEGSNTGTSAWITTPLIDLTPLNIPEFRFWYHMAGAAIQTMDVEINDGTGWVSVWSLTGAQQTATSDPWLEAIVNISAYAGDTVQFRFNGTNGGFSSDMAIDDVSVIEQPSCTQPSLLSLVSVSSNSGTIDWTSGGATAWQLEYGPLGFTPGTGTIVNATAIPFTITGLTPNTQYGVYVRDSCAPGSVGVWVGALSFATSCVPFAAPYSENFDGSTWVPGTGATNVNNQIDQCWSRTPGANTGAGPTLFTWGPWTGATISGNTGPTGDHTTGSDQYIFTEASGPAAGSVAEIISPEIDLVPLNVPELRFWYHMAGGTMGDLDVLVDDGSGFTSIFTLNGPQQAGSASPWLEAIIPLSAYAGDTIRVKFEGTRGASFNSDFALDDFGIDEAPACPQPTAVQVDFESSNSIDLSWTTGGATNWQIEYGPVGFTPGTGTIVAAGTNPFSITGLTPNTSYDFYVRDSCAAGSVSIWTGPITGTTACVSVTAPYSENFDGGTWVTGAGGNNANDLFDPCWVRNPDGNVSGSPAVFSWGTRAGGTSSVATGPSNGNGGAGNYIYTEASGVNNGDRAYVTSPLVDLSPLTNPELEVWYHMYGADIDSLTIEVNDGSGFVFLTAVVGQQQTGNGDPWLPLNVSLSAYAGSTIQVRFQTERLGFNGDVAIDDFSIQNAAACPPPFNLSVLTITSSSVEIDWTTGGASNAQIEYGPVGFTPGTGTVVNVGAPPQIVSGLTPNTTYEFYVRDSCAAGSVSTWAGPIGASTACAVVVAPYSEDFENGLWFGNGHFDAGGIDSCWNRNATTSYWWKGNSGATPTTSTGPSSDHTSGSGSYMYTETNSSNILNTEIISPEIDLSALAAPELRFWYHMYGSLIDELEVFAEDGTSSTSIVIITGGQQTNQTDPWLEQIVDLSAFIGSTIRLRFVANRTAGFNNQVDISIDDITIDETPACPGPSALTSSSATTTSIDIGWTTGGATNWQIEYGPVGFTPGTGTIVNATTNPFTITGLSPSASYDFYVRDSCGTGSVSSWTGPLGANTACGVAVAPYFQNFDNNFDEGTGVTNNGSTIDPCWSRNPASGYHWGGGQGGTGTGNTGPSADHTSGFGNYVYAEASFTSPGLTADLETPDIDLSPLTLPELRFWYHMFGASMGALQVDVFDGTNWVLGVDTIVGEQGNQWFERRIILSGFVGQTVKIRFVASTGVTPTQLGDIAIDDLSIIEGPTCPFPVNLATTGQTNNSVDLSWTTGGATNWQIEYGPAGFTPGTGTLINVATNPYTVTGLSPSTTYDFYVRDSCGLGDVSDWEGPLTQNTNCGTIIAPYFQNFDNNFDEGTGAANTGSTIDPCWTRNPVTGYHWGGGQGGTPTGTTGPSGDHTTGNGNYVYAEASFTNPGLTAELETPDIDLSPLTVPELRFWYHMLGANMGDLQVDIYDGTTWNTNVDQIVGDQGNQWFERIINLSAYAGQTIKIRFVAATGTTPTQFGDIAIDDLQIDEAPSCPDPSALTASTISNNSITLSWTTGGATNWQIEYGPAGFTPGTGTVVSVTNNPYTITGLTASTAYSFYLRDSCGAGDVSAWIGPLDVSTFSCPNGCIFNLRLTDSFGDGWDAQGGNQHDVEVSLNQTAPTSYTLPNGTQIDFGITVCDGDYLELDFNNNGAWSNECGVILSDPSGAIVYQLIPGNTLASGNLYSDTLDCGLPAACADPTGLSVTNIGLNDADVSFTSNSGISRIEFGPTGFTPGTGTLIALVTTSPFNITGLTPGTTYDVYVQDSCGIAVTSNWVGPVTFTATPCPPVTANYTFTTTGTTINVDGTSSSGSFFQWDFDGQGTSFDSIASFSFANEGTYTITLTNSSACGTSDVVSFTVDLCDSLVASFTDTVTFLSAQFNAVGSGGNPTSIAWNFGDGTVGSGVIANHNYVNPGTYTVWLSLTNACGQQDSISQVIQVCDSVDADIAYTFSGTTFSFDGSGSSTNSIDFQWYFGDGGTDSVMSPTYTYTSSGTYTVSLVTTNACGDTDSTIISITVCVKPTASWTFNVIQSSPLGMEVQFDASSSVGAVSYDWDFGDGGTNTTSGFPIHTYATPGFFYVVRLIVFNSCGDSDTLTASLASIGIDDVDFEAQLDIYPNPVQSSAQILWNSLPTDDDVLIELSDVSGNTIRTISVNVLNGKMETEIEMNELAQGVYMLRLRQGNREAVRRLIKD